MSHSTAIIHRVTSFLYSKRFFKPTWNSKFFLSLKWWNSSYFQLLFNFLPFSGTLTARDIYLAWTQKYIPFKFLIGTFFFLIWPTLCWDKLTMVQDLWLKSYLMMYQTSNDMKCFCSWPYMEGRGCRRAKPVRSDQW